MSFGQFQFRRDTAANWASNNPVLLAGEMGIETDTKQIKIGEGKSARIPYNAPPEAPREFIPIELENMQNITSPTIREIEKSTLKNADTTLASVVKVVGAVKITPYGTGTGHQPVLNEVLNAGDQQVSNGVKGGLGGGLAYLPRKGSGVLSQG